MTFGEMLRDWRGRRRLSQLALGLEADVSARHIAFLETGRAGPSRAMVLRLAEALAVPRPARNDLLHAAGFAPAHRARPLQDPDLAPLAEALGWTLARHAPYPALVLDRSWGLVDWNAPAAALLGAAGVGPGDNLLATLFSPGRGPAVFENWGEIGHHVAARLRTESRHLGGAPELDAAAARLAGDPAVAGYRAPEPLPPFVPARLRAGPGVLSFVSTVAQFGSAEELTLSDLVIELLFPADAPTRDFLWATARPDAPAG